MGQARARYKVQVAARRRGGCAWMRGRGGRVGRTREEGDTGHGRGQAAVEGLHGHLGDGRRVRLVGAPGEGEGGGLGVYRETSRIGPRPPGRLALRGLLPATGHASGAAPCLGRQRWRPYQGCHTGLGHTGLGPFSTWAAHSTPGTVIDGLRSEPSRRTPLSCARREGAGWCARGCLVCCGVVGGECLVGGRWVRGWVRGWVGA